VDDGWLVVRVLVVEDEVYLADALRDGLRREAIAADVVYDGDRALEYVEITDYDALILDRDIPGTHGDEVCRQVNITHPDVKVLMLTAARGLEQRVEGFELGADDYLLNPFEFPELVARLRALSRRQATSAPPVLAFGGITLDPFRREVYRNGRFVRLSRKEFAVLELLMRARGGVVSAEVLLEKAWDGHADPFTNAVRVTISTLRRRLGEPSRLTTVAGVGYKIEADDE
jgi:two-component system response regulator VanR